MSSLLLLILLLSLSIEACNGRNLNFDIKDSTVPSHHLSKESDQKALLSLKPFKKGLKIGDLLGGASIQRSEVVKMKKEVISGAVPILSHVKVSLSPARKNRSKYPGFHVDYVGPRTHPPAHN